MNIQTFSSDCNETHRLDLAECPASLRILALGPHPDDFDAVGEKEAEWKGELLRCHRSQHARNLNTRGHGFDDRILKVNQVVAESLRLDAPYAEAFEFTLW